MTEEEKRLKALAFMAAEKARLASSSFRDYRSAETAEAQHRITEKKKTFAALEQNGITWDDLRNAYHTAFQSGHDAMLTFKLSFFYAGSAIAFHESFRSEAEQTATFINQMIDIAEEYPDRAAIISQCLAETNIDTSVFDENGTQSSGRALITTTTATRKDREAVERMRKSGITQKDLEYERQVGYTNGWNTGAGMGACYGCAALALHRFHGLDAGEIEQFIERIQELQDEEISASDIIARAVDETGVDVTELAAGKSL